MYHSKISTISPTDEQPLPQFAARRLDEPAWPCTVSCPSSRLDLELQIAFSRIEQIHDESLRDRALGALLHLVHARVPACRV